MKKIIICLMIGLVLFSCNDDDFLDREPTNILVDEAVWDKPNLVLSVLIDLYGRIPTYQHIGESGIDEFVELNEAFGSDGGLYGNFTNRTYGYDKWSLWSYDLMREVNLFIQKCESATGLKEADQKRFLAEGKFIRAMLYFEMVKRMGGVPLITEPLTYDFSGDPSYLQYPRAKESEVYDFIISEMEAIKSDLPLSGDSKSRATNGAALALESRAALYAASIAKYGVNTPLVTLPGEEVGIPVSKAEGYYQTALTAAKELMSNGKYSLYTKKVDEGLSANFANLFLDESKNPEVIFVEDFMEGSNKSQPWTLRNQPYSLAEDLEGGRLNPSLNLVQLFEKLDNTYSQLETKDSEGNYIYYDNPQDIFANRDARLEGSVIVPGSKFKGGTVDIFAGVYIQADGSIVTGSNYGSAAKLPGDAKETQVVGFDGPINGLQYTAQSGFYVRKYMDLTEGSGERGARSGTWHIYFRYGEVLLNAAEAAFELNQKDEAAGYMNQLRNRAGFTTPLTASDITFDRIVNERRVELAFEGHTLWDNKRWRIAHIVWDGVDEELTNTPGIATSPSGRPFGLWPYKVHDPDGPMDNKYIYKEVLPSRVTASDEFRMGNYYSKISDGIINNNPKIVRNPNQN